MNAETSLLEALGPVYSRPFRGVGMQSLGSVIDAIVYYGLQPCKDYFIIGPGGPRVPRAGRKIWTALLEMLRVHGFDWEQYIVRKYRPWHSSRTRRELELDIGQMVEQLYTELKILSSLLQMYKELRVQENILDA